jgi:hypothetical protein
MRPGDRSRAAPPSACRAAEIVVDDLNIDEAPLARDIDQIILPPLALQVGHDLGLRRLPHIDDGLALEDVAGISSALVIAQAPRQRGLRPASGSEPAPRCALSRSAEATPSNRSLSNIKFICRFQGRRRQSERLHRLPPERFRHRSESVRGWLGVSIAASTRRAPPDRRVARRPSFRRKSPDRASNRRSKHDARRPLHA